MIDYRKELEDRGLDVVDSGSGYIMMNCPLPDHEDSNPSFSVNLKDGKWRCFGCEERGIFVELIAELDGTSESLAATQLKSQDTTDTLVSSIEESLEEDDDSVQYLSMRSFHNVFPPVLPGMDGWKYLLGRGLTPLSILHYDVRWGDHGKYADRVIVPIRMSNGRLLSYVGRSIGKGVLPKTRKARSPARTLYGIYELWRYFEDFEYIVLVEGEFDAIYLQQFGVPAVAVMGTSVINRYQLQILRKARVTVVLSYDGDEAGRIAMYGDGKNRQGELATLSRYMPTITIDLPEGSDPNDLSEQSVQKVYASYVADG